MICKKCLDDMKIIKELSNEKFNTYKCSYCGEEELFCNSCGAEAKNFLILDTIVMYKCNSCTENINVRVEY